MSFEVKKWSVEYDKLAVARKLMLLGIEFIYNGEAIIFDAPEAIVRAIKIVSSGSILEVENEEEG
jgi:hypothetical protein